MLSESDKIIRKYILEVQILLHVWYVSFYWLLKKVLFLITDFCTLGRYEIEIPFYGKVLLFIY